MAIPEPLLAALDDLAPAIESADHALILLDFDGTLAPIAEFPWLARLPTSARATLERLARMPGCTVGIVSGRSLEDVRERVGLDGLIYAGNHGLEIAGGGLRFDEPTAVGLEGAVDVAVAALDIRLAGIAGVVVEPKGRSASVHFRRVRLEDWGEVERGVRNVVPEGHPCLVIVPGKMVWEVRPKVDWNKGTAIRWMRDRLGLGRALTIYFGDDRTDEDAFAEIGRSNTARVGLPQTTQAGYRVADTGEVIEFLQWLTFLRRFSEVADAH